MRTKEKLKAFEDVAKPLGEMILELRISCGPYAAVNDSDLFQSSVRSRLLSVCRATDPWLALGFMMTAMVLNVSEDALDEVDPTIQRYAMEFLTEHKRDFAEMILAWA